MLCRLTPPPYASRTELDELRARIGRDLPGTTVSLGPLGQAEARQLAQWALPNYPEDALDRLTRRVLSDTAGLPLLLVELLHAVALGMELSPDAVTWPQPTKTLDQTLPGELPDPIVAATRVGFRRLSSAAQQTLSAIAVLGDRADADTVERVTGLDRDVLLPALDELEWQRWVTATGRAYGIVAKITREVILRDMLTPGQRERLQQTANLTVTQ